MVAADAVEELAALIRDRNAIDHRIAQIIGRPPVSGHHGDWVAATIFGIKPEASATATDIDGSFETSPLAGKTVNIKSYGTQEGLLDIAEASVVDYYLILTGPTAAAASSRNTTRPWCVNAVYLFDTNDLLAEQRARNVKLGIASSVTKAQWQRAEIYPAANKPFPLTQAQIDLLSLFHSDR